MSGLDRMRGAVALPQAGDGVVMKLLSKDRLEMQTEFGEGWLGSVETKLVNQLSEEFLIKVLTLAVKDREGKRVDLPDDIVDVIDAKGLPPMVLARQLADAVFLGASGRTYSEHCAWLVVEQSKIAEEITKLSPPKSPVVS